MTKQNNKYLGIALIMVIILIGTYIFEPILDLTNLIGKILLPFLVSFGVAFVLQPVVNYLIKKTKIKRIFAQLIVLVTFIAFFVFLMANVLPLALSQVNNLLLELDKGLANLASFIDSEEIKKLLEGFDYNALVNVIVETITARFNDIMSLFPVVILSPILFIYFFFGYETIEGAIKKVVIDYKFYKFYAYLKKLKSATVVYLGGLSLTIIILSILSTLAFTVIGLEKALVLGMLIGVSTIIPYFGAFISGAFAALVALSTSVELAIVTLIVILVVQTIESNIITPNIQAKSFSLHPILIILSITVFSNLLGFAGMLLAIPLLLAIKLFYSMFVDEKVREMRELKSDKIELDKKKYFDESE